MNITRTWGKALLGLHLALCAIWLWFFLNLHSDTPVGIPEWIGHVLVWSILGVQFTWGFTVGLIVGPTRARRNMLWWSLLLIFLPLWFLSMIAIGLLHSLGLLLTCVYMGIFVLILACETFCGVLLGARTHSEDAKTD